MRSEEDVIEKIREITTDNKELLDCDLTTVVESAALSFKRAMVMINLNVLYWIIGQERPKFKCDVKPN